MRKRRLRNLNLAKAKSAHRAALRPSLPNMPIPTWASCIMDTSFAPSPIAHVIHFGLEFLTSLTILNKKNLKNVS